MSALQVPVSDTPFIEALRSLMRTGVMATPSLEQSPLIDMPIVLRTAGQGASPTRRADAFTKVLRRIIKQRLEGKEAQTATILFGLEDYAGVPIQDRYRAVAKLYNPYWTWESYRKEPLTRHLLAVYLALKREAELDEAAELEERPSLKKSGTARKVLIVQNITYEGPGLLERLLKEVAVDYQIVDLHKGQTFPDPTKYAALVVMGGPDSANDETPKMVAERAQVAKALDAGVPYLGICLGLQVAVKGMSGKVVPSVKEVGLAAADGTPYSVSLTDLALTAMGRKDPLFVGLQDTFRVFQIHGEMVELTRSMQLLATGRDCHNQIVKLRRNAYGIQSHFELTRDMLEVWLNMHPDLSPFSEKQMLAEFDAIEEVYTITGLSLLRNFLHIAGLLG